MGDVGASDHPSPSGSSSSFAAAASSSSSSSSVTRLLQHAILQLCNEHVGYDHTLQVLGVLCVTVDDRAEEIVVKVNNTLKRVDAVSAAAAPDYAGVRVSTTSLVAARGSSVAAAGGSESVTCSSTGGAGMSVSGLSSSSEPAPSGTHCIVGSLLADADGSRGSSPSVDVRMTVRDSPQLTVESLSAVVSGSNSAGGRRCHGRKQSNPVKVKNFSVQEENEAQEAPMDGESSPLRPGEAFCGGNVHDEHLMSSTARSGGGDKNQMEIGQASGQRLLGGKRTSVDAFGSVTGRFRASRHDSAPASSMTVRALLTNLQARNAADRALSGALGSPVSAAGRETSPDETVRRTPIIVAPIERKDDQRDDVGQQQQQQQDTALNFSMNALDSGSRSATNTPRSSEREDHAKNDTRYGLNGVKVKEEYHSAFQQQAYNVDYLLNAAAAGGNAYDLSQLVANYGSFLGENQFLSMSGFDPHHLALVYGSLAAAGGCSSLSALGGQSPLSSATQRPTGASDIGSAESGNACQASGGEQPRRYAVTNRLNNGLTMHFSRTHPAIRRRNRFGRHPGIAGPGKVKDIILYDESAPLHAQRGSRIEGDFMLDSLRVDGKRRRRRTAEDTLTAEEIAEYMGCDTRSPSGGGAASSTASSSQIPCRYCGEVTADLSRYFSHTLSSHGAYICHQCGKSFTTKSSLLRHRPIHTGMRRFACSICRKAFYRKDKCKAHIKRHLGIGDAPAISNGAGRVSQMTTPTSEQSPFNGGSVDVAV
jgi:hypothetical protein